MHMSLEIICLKVKKNQHPTNHCPIFLYRVFQFAQPFNKFQAIFIILLDKNKTKPKTTIFKTFWKVELLVNPQSVDAINSIRNSV